MVKDARIRQDKAEEESVDLTNKAKHLEIECDVYGEKLSLQVMAQEAMEAQVLSAEAEFNRLNRRWDLNMYGYPLGWDFWDRGVNKDSVGGGGKFSPLP